MFFRDATKIQNGRQRSTPNFFVGAKTEKLKSVIIHILQSHYPPSGNVQGILMKFKMTTKVNFLNDLGLQASC